ncbi:MAG TPA: class I SAM-dependent methyltransferase [Solirubrobacteraceae bacterium]|jgi:SAM-dependent methyltransferase
MLRAVAAHVPEAPKARVRRALGPRYHRVFPRWHRERVGGLWDELGELQQRFLVEQGLLPEHRFLDVGCGALRAGVHLIRYLEPGRYHGVEVDPDLLDAGGVELERHGLAGRSPRLLRDGRFGFGAFGERFDYGIAHSVFTHLPVNDILVCLLNVEKVLARPGGRFYATFFETPHGTRSLEAVDQPRSDGPPQRTTLDADPFHYGLDLFEWLCHGTGLRVEYLGDWGHPRSQKMLVFTPADR